jgi:hypothetical protein
MDHGHSEKVSGSLIAERAVPRAATTATLPADTAYSPGRQWPRPPRQGSPGRAVRRRHREDARALAQGTVAPRMPSAPCQDTLQGTQHRRNGAGSTSLALDRKATQRALHRVKGPGPAASPGDDAPLCSGSRMPRRVGRTTGPANAIAGHQRKSSQVRHVGLDQQRTWAELWNRRDGPGWSGATFHVSMHQIHGPGLSANNRRTHASWRCGSAPSRTRSTGRSAGCPAGSRGPPSPASLPSAALPWSCLP